MAYGVECPACGWRVTHVTESRAILSKGTMRRRRECLRCRHRFTTHEVYAETMEYVERLVLKPKGEPHPPHRDGARDGDVEGPPPDQT